MIEPSKKPISSKNLNSQHQRTSVLKQFENIKKIRNMRKVNLESSRVPCRGTKARSLQEYSSSPPPNVDERREDVLYILLLKKIYVFKLVWKVISS